MLESGLSIIHGMKTAYELNSKNKMKTLIESVWTKMEECSADTAIIYHDEKITYKELRHTVIRLIGSLIKEGVNQNSYVLCYGHRGLQYYSIMLAIMSIGAIYVPLDPYMTENRIFEVLGQFQQDARDYFIAKTKYLLTAEEEKKISRIARKYKVNPISYPENDQEREMKIKDCSLFAKEADDYAYCVFTSGTTGKPKGVLIHQQSLLNHNLAKIEEFNITQDDVIAQTSSQLFDVHIWQILTPLFVGASVVVLDKCEIETPINLINKVNKHEITILNMVPTLFNFLIDELENDKSLIHKLKSLRYVLVTGEALPSRYCIRWFEIFDIKNPPKIINAYGPAECGDDVCHMLLSSKEDCQLEPIPIGINPIRNLSFYVLNKNTLNPVEIGEEGILFIAGDGVGKGYLNTNNIKNSPFVKICGNIKAYNTGDRVKITTAGIQYLGRVENSFVKISGQRVDLTDLTQPIRKYEGVATAIPVSYKTNYSSMIALYVTFEKTYIEKQRKKIIKEASSEIAKVFDNVIENSNSSLSDFNHSGWNNYNNRPFSERAVKENLDDALSNILPLIDKNSNVLEVGCGTGMLAAKIAPACNSFMGIDPSEKSLQVARQACQNFSNASFLNASATELNSNLSSKKFHVVYFNAVINYLSDLSELEDILKQCNNLLEENGKIIILDIYHLFFKDLIHYEFEFMKAVRSHKNMNIKELYYNINLKLHSDPDLFLHPSFFSSLLDKISSIKSVKFFLKTGCKDDLAWPNPMVRYRYGAILDRSPMPKFPYPVETINWDNQKLNSITKLKEYLHKFEPQSLILTGVPNSRTTQSLALMKRIKNSFSSESLAVSSLKFSKNLGIDSLVDPDLIAKSIIDAGYRVDNMFFDVIDPGKFNLALVKNNIEDKLILDHEYPQQAVYKSNYSMFNKIASNLRQKIYSCLAEYNDKKIVSYINVLVIPSFPMTNNGKIDIQYLLKKFPPSEKNYSGFNLFSDAENKIEKTISGIVKSNLTLNTLDCTVIFKISTRFDKMALPSIVRMRILTEINRALDINLTLTQFDQLGNISALSEYICSEKEYKSQNLC